ncbi:hypothetical protein J4G02_17780 [Candidatus Poribacteria bacterium]|nr:hypothetical protein [Candidatus Poribacteria bacterium]
MIDLKRTWGFVFGFVSLVLLVVPTVAQTGVPAVCLIGDHPGIPESDAQTAALLVCDELRKQGISVTDPVYEAPASTNAYRVVLRRLGEKIFVRLSQEKPIGTIIAERQLTLANIEEMIPAAPRLVDALVHNKPIEDTVDMETVTEQEARELRKISGESLWHVGIFGTFVPGTDIAAEPGFEYGWSYQTPLYAVGTEFRTSGRDAVEGTVGTGIQNSEPEGFSFLAWSIGGRYFFNKRNISPYVGGGLAIVNTSHETKVRIRERNWPSFVGEGEEWFGLIRESHNSDWGYTYDSESDTGLGAYAIVGIEALRLTQSRLNIELRVDRPLFKLPSQDIMPITFGISFSRNYVPGGSGCLSGCLF